MICDRYIASSIAYGDAHGIDAAWLTEIQKFLPAPDLTILLDIAPDTAVGRKAQARDRFERDLDAARRVRASYRRQATAPAGSGSKASAPRVTSRLTSFTRSRHDSCCRHRADVGGASRAQDHRARFDRGACRAHIVDEHHSKTLDIHRTSTAARANAPPTLPCRASAGRSVCEGVALVRRRASASGTPRCRQLARLIESPCRCRLRWSGTGTTRSAREELGGAVAEQAPRPRDSERQPSYLKAWRIARSVPSYGTDGAARRHRRRVRRQRAQHPPSLRPAAPRGQRVAAAIAQRRREPGDAVPAFVADRPARRL